MSVLENRGSTRRRFARLNRLWPIRENDRLANSRFGPCSGRTLNYPEDCFSGKEIVRLFGLRKEHCSFASKLPPRRENVRVVPLNSILYPLSLDDPLAAVEVRHELSLSLSLPLFRFP